MRKGALLAETPSGEASISPLKGGRRAIKSNMAPGMALPFRL
jgi:hypothetical protein